VSKTLFFRLRSDNSSSGAKLSSCLGDPPTDGAPVAARREAAAASSPEEHSAALPDRSRGTSLRSEIIDCSSLSRDRPPPFPLPLLSPSPHALAPCPQAGLAQRTPCLHCTARFEALSLSVLCRCWRSAVLSPAGLS